jgi:phosphoribosylglycinamide formyltransferase-1
MTPPRLSVAVLVSGRGSNLQALIDAVENGRLAVNLDAVISNDPAAEGLQRAAAAGIATFAEDHRQFASRAAFDEALVRRLDALTPDLIVLAGFMRVLGASVVDRFLGRLINIHPSLLPAFPGLRTHQRALDDGASRHGATVHFVTAKLDGGPAIAQAVVPVLPGDDADRLAARVLEREHVLLPWVVGLFAEGRVCLDAHGCVLVDGKPLPSPLLLQS